MMRTVVDHLLEDVVKRKGAAAEALEAIENEW
jgi:hypothetical protein